MNLLKEGRGQISETAGRRQHPGQRGNKCKDPRGRKGQGEGRDTAMKSGRLGKGE